MGKIGDVYTIDDYVIAAIDVYLDILNLFVMILRLLGDRR
jgi:FtsH-binding integral membrane protein